MKRRAWWASPFERDAAALVTALALLLGALFMPKVQMPHDAYEYVIVFDITQSMDVADYELEGSPASRLDYARHAVRQVLRELPCGSRIGWGAFAEYRSLLLLEPVEVCSNYSDLLASLETIDGRMRWANASEVIKGVYWSVRASLEVSSKPDVVFISDGQEAPPIFPGTPLSMPEDVKAGQARGWIIGAGGDTPQRIPHTDGDGRRVGYWRENDVIQFLSEDGTKIVSAEHLSALREPHLEAVAARVGFAYSRLTTPESLRAALLDSRFVRQREAPMDLYWIPLSLAVLVLLLRFRPRGTRVLHRP